MGERAHYILILGVTMGLALMHEGINKDTDVDTATVLSIKASNSDMKSIMQASSYT
jgi:hypothetical protein